MSDPAALQGLSAVSLFLHADPVVKGVMLLLVLASVACWAVIVEKAIHFAGLRHRLARLETMVASGDALKAAQIGSRAAADAPQAILAAAAREWRSDPGEPHESRAERRDRLERAMRAALGLELRRLEFKLPLLAAVASASPFVGLFGTVWGIMHSFNAIAQSNDTSLAVVAPGIAEALFATAIGLAAAIPAVIGYNKLAVDLGRIADRLKVAISEIGNQMARQPAGVALAEAAD